MDGRKAGSVVDIVSCVIFLVLAIFLPPSLLLPLPPCRVSWPHTLVVPPAQLSHYQLVFKLLLSLKLTERQLSTAWHRITTSSR